MTDAAGDEKYPDHANARRVYCFLISDSCTPRMPLHGPYWSQDQLDLYQRWMNDGFSA